MTGDVVPLRPEHPRPAPERHRDEATRDRGYRNVIRAMRSAGIPTTPRQDEALPDREDHR